MTIKMAESKAIFRREPSGAPKTDAERIAELERKFAESERQRAALQPALRYQLEFFRSLPKNGILREAIMDAYLRCEAGLRAVEVITGRKGRKKHVRNRLS